MGVRGRLARLLSNFAGYLPREGEGQSLALFMPAHWSVVLQFQTRSTRVVSAWSGQLTCTSGPASVAGGAGCLWWRSAPLR